jgi:glycosyltransferase involved in cell wall biosynthesis
MSETLTNAGPELGNAPDTEPSVGRRRVAFVTDIPTPYMVELLKALAELVELTVLFCSGTGTRALPWALDEELRFDHQVIDGVALRSGAPNRPDYYLSPRVLSALARSRPEAVVSAGYSLPTAYSAIHCWLRRTPLIIYSEGTSQSECNLGRHQAVARAILLRAASVCVAISQPAVERFVELGVRPDRVFLGRYTSAMDPLWKIGRNRDYERKGTFTVLTAGRLVPHKGVDKLFLAAAEASRENPELRIVVVGSGPEEARLRQLAATLGLAVEFAGFVNHRDLPEQYARADAFAFPTLEDPFGIVLLEAAAAGLPLIASPHAGATWDLIRHQQNGLIVDPDDHTGFAAALRDLAESPQRRRSLGQRALSATLGRSPTESARGYLSAIEAAVRQRGRAKR